VALYNECYEQIKKEVAAELEELKSIKAKDFKETIYLICVYQKTIRIKIIQIDNKQPKFCDLLDEIEIDTQSVQRNILSSNHQALELLENFSNLDLSSECQCEADVTADSSKGLCYEDYCSSQGLLLNLS